MSGPPAAPPPRSLPPGRALHQLEPYAPPAWAAPLPSPPAARFALATGPTPLHRWDVPGLPPGMELWVKRDDLTGCQLSGNKVRKLEFLVAEALARGADAVLTAGGVQSNHARATAVAARYAGLAPHLLLRTSAAAAGGDPGLVGNLLVGRLVGAAVHLCTKEEYGRLGSPALLALLARELRARGARPYVVPVGGSGGVGTWGYLECAREIREAEAHALAGNGGAGGDGGSYFTDVVCACGSGGTAAGLALGGALSGAAWRVRAYGVCDTPDYFYDFVDGLLGEVGAPPRGAALGGRAARDLLTVVQARGAGYALSRPDELALVAGVAAATGVVLDPVYTGKALLGLLAEARAAPGEWAGRRVVFVHTGGLLGLYDKAGELAPLVEARRDAGRLAVPPPG